MTSKNDLLKLDHQDLKISPSSVNTYRTNLRTYLSIQLRLFGIGDRISVTHFTNMGQLSKEKRKSLGFTAAISSTIKKYIDKTSFLSSPLDTSKSDNSLKSRQHSAVISAANQRVLLKNSQSKSFAIKIESLSENFREFIKDYQDQNKHLENSTITKRIDEIRRFLGYIHYIKDKNKSDNEGNLIIFEQDFTDIITAENFEGFSDYMRSRNDAITSTAVKVLQTVYSLIDTDKPWMSKYLNPIRSKNPKIRSIAHRSGRKGLINDLQEQFYETGQNIYKDRHSDLINSQVDIFSTLTSEESDTYTYQARIGYLNKIKLKLEKIVQKYKKESDQKGMTRNPFLPIMPLLELDRPLHPIHLALKKSAADINELIKLSPTRKIARVIRNHIFVRLISFWPLRRSHWLKMTYLVDQSGHISLTEKGDLLLRIPISEFKNSESKEFKKMGIKGNTIDFTFSYAKLGSLIDLIKIYINAYLPLLENQSGIFFYSSATSLDKECKAWQSTYLHPVCDELEIARPLLFGPHSFRHICVTNMLKKGEQIETAANLLLDLPQTVRSRYSAFLPSDGLQTAIEKMVDDQIDMDREEND